MSNETESSLWWRRQARLERAPEYCEWGQYVFERLIDLDGSLAWLARTAGIRESTLNAAMRGRDPAPGMLRKIGDALSLTDEQKCDLYAEWMAYMDQKALPSYVKLDDKSRKARRALARFLAPSVFETNHRQLPSLYYLPFILHSLAPLEIRSGRVSIRESALETLQVPPRFLAPIQGSRPHLVVVEEARASEIDLAGVQVLENGQDVTSRISKMESISAARVASLLFESNEGAPVVAPYTGVVMKLDASDTYGTVSLTLDLQNGYVLEVNGLSEARALLGEAVEQGRIIGRAGWAGDKWKMVGANQALEWNGKVFGTRLAMRIKMESFDEYDFKSVWLDPRIMTGHINLPSTLNLTSEDIELKQVLMEWDEFRPIAWTGQDIPQSSSVLGLDLRGPIVVLPGNKLIELYVSAVLSLLTVGSFILQLRRKKP